jgi:HSP20 family protein
MKKSLIPWRRERAETAMIRPEDSPFVDLHRRMNDLFDSFFSDFETGLSAPPGLLAGRRTALALPRVDVAETDTELVVSADLPGLEEKDLRVTVDDDVLSIRGTRQEEREEKKRSYHLMERSYGEFQRSIPLPADVDPDRVKASFKKGVLTVTLPKRPEAQAKRKAITIETE